ncbi:uncharacterized protein LOC125503042 [Dendroctonus ponderosae]|uniref:uncharacterized protein LOC125503033 n=1 Tax=Dendroctonus ponderosae TaxID=77166 RepID=UPI0020365805|nr:uncharacterized protein LOC125503033 [Dendroctonus ponderosae]XP_048518729.1 uncharacterized protein LOC125503042 [Dendroctonus ponderosae]
MEDASRRYRKRSYYNRILSNEQTDCEEHSENSKKVKETNGKRKTEQLDAIGSGNSFNRITNLSGNNIFAKLTAGLEIKPCWYNSDINNNNSHTLIQSTTCDYRNKSRCSNRFIDDVVLNTSDFPFSYTNKLSQWERDLSYSSNSIATPELDDFFDKYSKKQYLSEELKWKNDTPRVADSICSENSYNCFNESSPLESLSIGTFAASKSTQEEKKKYILTSLLRDFKQNTSLKTIGGCSRRHENIPKRLIKPIKNSISKSATGEGNCFVGKYILT